MKVSTLASRVACSRQHLWQVERGEKVPSALLLHDVARALGVLVDALYDRDWSWKRKNKLHELPGIVATTNCRRGGEAGAREPTEGVRSEK